MCVQNPSFCQDSVYMVSLASRSCLGINRGAMDSIKKAKSSTRPMVPSSHKKNFLPGSVSTIVKKFCRQIFYCTSAQLGQQTESKQNSTVRGVCERSRQPVTSSTRNPWVQAYFPWISGSKISATICSVASSPS